MHYIEDIKPIFLKWKEVDIFPLKNQYPDFNNISLPLYMEVADRIRQKDKFGEALPHLDDKAYEKAKKVYDNIFSLQYRHNKLVSDVVGELESSITSILSDCHIPDNGHEHYSLHHLIQALKGASASHQSQLNENQQMVNDVSYIDFTLAGITFARSRVWIGIRFKRFHKMELTG